MSKFEVHSFTYNSVIQEDVKDRKYMVSKIRPNFKTDDFASTACTESFQLQNIPNESWSVIVK